MSKKLILCLAFFAGCLSYAAAQAELHFEKTTFDFGEFMEKDIQTAVFTFTNTGNEPLIIHQAMTTCGCTVADYTKSKIMPGKTGEVRITYNGKNKPRGHFKKVVTIRSNAATPMTRIYVTGTMKAK
ncbi:MAG: DUF1573 domain-containing protein [Alloprevotella sp.]|nr:DUF1573 domain-containing protein [Alloprevotella sp.]